MAVLADSSSTPYCLTRVSQLQMGISPRESRVSRASGMTNFAASAFVFSGSASDYSNVGTRHSLIANGELLRQGNRSGELHESTLNLSGRLLGRVPRLQRRDRCGDGTRQHGLGPDRDVG